MSQGSSSFEVSVVLATYNSALHVTQTLQSIVRQTLDCVREIIVVDDASTDDSREVVSRFGDPRIRLVLLDSNRGVSVARQIGMESARCDWIAFNDADDVWLDDKLERQFLLLKQYPDAVGCVGGSGRLDRDGRRQWHFGFGRWKWRPEDNPSPAALPDYRPVLDGCVYLQSLLVRRKTALSEAFRPELRLMQDQDYMFRLARHGRFLTTERPVFLYRLGYANTTAPGKMRAREFLANRDYLYRTVDARATGQTEPNPVDFLKNYVASSEDIETFEFAQKFRYFNTIWVQHGVSVAALILISIFAGHPLSTLRYVGRRLVFRKKR